MLHKGSLGLRSLRHEFCIFDWIPGPISPRSPDFSGILEYDSKARFRIPKTKIPDLTFKILGSSRIHIVLNLVTITLF